MPGIEPNGRMAANPQCPAASVPSRNSCFAQVALLAFAFTLGTHSVVAQQPPQSIAYADTTARERVGPAADVGQPQRLIHWIAQNRDHQGKPFFLIDKVNATLYVFDQHARLTAQSPVLLGAAVGDDSVPGIGDRPMAQILPSERTTPAGRFVAEAGRNLQGEDVVWIDHAAAVSMHRLRSSNLAEHRAHRMSTATADDNRISYGCINVPVAFYNRYVQPAFARLPTAIVYVMPETRSMEQQFGIAPPAPRNDVAHRASTARSVTRVSKR